MEIHVVVVLDTKAAKQLVNTLRRIEKDPKKARTILKQLSAMQ